MQSFQVLGGKRAKPAKRAKRAKREHFTEKENEEIIKLILSRRHKTWDAIVKNMSTSISRTPFDVSLQFYQNGLAEAFLKQRGWKKVRGVRARSART